FAVTVESSKRAVSRVMPAINRNHGAAQIRRRGGSREYHDVGNFLNARGPAQRESFDELAPAFGIAELVGCARLHERDEALGLHGTGTYSKHANAVLDAVAAERARESIERRIAGRTGDIPGVEPVCGKASDVDDHTLAVAAHCGIVSAAEIDVAKHLQVPGGAPSRFVHGQQVTTRYRASVVDKNVGGAGSIDQRGEIGRAH